MREYASLPAEDVIAAFKEGKPVYVLVESTEYQRRYIDASIVKMVIDRISFFGSMPVVRMGDIRSIGKKFAE